MFTIFVAMFRPGLGDPKIILRLRHGMYFGTSDERSSRVRCMQKNPTYELSHHLPQFML